MKRVICYLGMDIEREIFASYRPINDKLIAYGFDCFKDIYTYSKDFNNDEFKALITIDEHGVLSGKVIEKAFNEEYTQIHNDSYKGGFIASIREDYQDILFDIRNKCFKKEIFVSNQANRLTKLIEEKYHELSDFPFSDPHIVNYGVFRYHGNQKWYGLIMNVSKSVFGHYNKEDYVDVINVRIDEEKREEILKNKNIYPSYHMNKQKWVSIILDDTYSDDKVMEYIDYSRNFMIGKTTRKNNERLYFIQPCNPKFYDLEAAFIKDSGVTDWKQSRKVNIGDICYMYVANPIGAIKYKCEVVETDIPFEYKSKEVSMSKLMKIKLLQKVDNNDINFKYLKTLGISLIRGPVSIDEKVAKEIDKKI